MKLTRAVFTLLSGFGLLLSAAVASAAIVESEFNGAFANADAGDSGTLTGYIGDGSAPSSDVDIWGFTLTQGVPFLATLSNGPGPDYNIVAGFEDPAMVLFWENNGNYYPVAGVQPGTGLTVFFNTFITGQYFLTVSSNGNSPLDTFGNPQWQPAFWTTNPSSPGTAWGSFQGTGFTSLDYSLSVSGAAPPVPLPAAFWLFASAVSALGVGYRRRRRA